MLGGRQVEAHDAYGAALRYFERTFSYEPFTAMRVTVVDEDGKRWKVRVTVEMRPSFDVTIHEAKPRTKHKRKAARK